MNLIELSALMQDEKKCEEYLRQVGILKNHTNCLKCNSTKIGRVRRNRWKCYECNYEWHIRRKSILNLTKLDFSVFIALLNYFAEEYSIEKCSKVLTISESVVSNIYKIIRASISNIDFTTFKVLNRKGTIADKNPLFMILECDNKIEIKIISNTNNSEIKDVILFAKRHKNEQNQICYNYDLEHPDEKSRYEFRPFDNVDRFWRHAKPKLTKQFISREANLYLYLNELALRHNYQEKEFYDIIISKIAQNEWVADYWGSLG